MDRQGFATLTGILSLVLLMSVVAVAAQSMSEVRGMSSRLIMKEVLESEFRRVKLSLSSKTLCASAFAEKRKSDFIQVLGVSADLTRVEVPLLVRGEKVRAANRTGVELHTGRAVFLPAQGVEWESLELMDLQSPAGSPSELWILRARLRHGKQEVERWIGLDVLLSPEGRVSACATAPERREVAPIPEGTPAAAFGVASVCEQSGGITRSDGTCDLSQALCGAVGGLKRSGESNATSFCLPGQISFAVRRVVRDFPIPYVLRADGLSVGMSGYTDIARLECQATETEDAYPVLDESAYPRESSDWYSKRLATRVSVGEYWGGTHGTIEVEFWPIGGIEQYSFNTFSVDSNRALNSAGEPVQPSLRALRYQCIYVRRT